MRLIDIRVNEVSLVDKAANRKTFCIVKRDETKVEKEEVKTEVKTEEKKVDVEAIKTDLGVENVVKEEELTKEEMDAIMEIATLVGELEKEVKNL